MARTAQPNILLLLPDQHRADFLESNKALPLRTPNILELERRGVRFDRAYTPSPLCAPARACLAAGATYDRCGVPNNGFDFPVDQQTYYRLLRKAGYHVAGVGKFDLHKKTQDWGLDGSRCLDAWGFSAGIDNEGKIDAIRSGANEPHGPYMAHLYERGLAAEHVRDLGERHQYLDTHPTPLPDDAYCDNWIAENGLRMLNDMPEGKPWHLVVNFTGPHSPMDVTQTMLDRWQDIDIPGPHRNTQYDDAAHRRIRRNYAAMIENIDRHIGRFVEAVEARGETGRTLVIFSSDHGEMLGDHDLWGKTSWRQSSIRIPMVIAGLHSARGRKSDALVSLHDLAATILDYAGIDTPASMDARSMRAVIEGERISHREAVVVGLNDWRTVIGDRWKLVREGGGRDHLFDLANDPLEDTDLIDDFAPEREALARFLA